MNLSSIIVFITHFEFIQYFGRIYTRMCGTVERRDRLGRESCLLQLFGTYFRFSQNNFTISYDQDFDQNENFAHFYDQKPRKQCQVILILFLYKKILLIIQ